MDYQPLPLGRMQECGSSLLKSLQNDSMVPLDLLVRESIQNSLDAAAGTGPVRVDFGFTEHTTGTVSGLLGGPVAEALRRRYPEARYRQLVISDRNTVGLGGPLRVEELEAGQAHGDFFKLVYAVGKSQDEANRGGSWGLGKTIYFRIGCGLVFYYTRIRAGGAFEERLAACLVEHEESPGKLQENSQTGIGWWGAGEEGPLVESGEIARVLKALGVTPYRGEETGAVVVVPFLMDNLGPREAEPDDQGNAPASAAPAPWWHRSYSDYVRVAIQRWYGIRLNNPKFPAPPLEAAVDGVVISDRDTMSVVKIARHLHQCCLDGVAGSRKMRSPFSSEPIAVEVSEIPLRAAVQGAGSVGRVAIALVTRQQLGMAPPDNLPAPQTVLTGRRKDATAPIVGFLRGPGMIIQWDGRGDSSGWAWKVPPPPEGQYLLAVVVPDGRLPLHPKVAETAGVDPAAGHTLEWYLRNCEKADHNDWIDPVGQTVVKRMRKHVADRLQLLAPQASVIVPATRPFLGARTVADRLLPVGFGNDGRRPGAEDGGTGADRNPGKSRSKLPRLDILRMEYNEHGFTLHWRLSWTGKPAPADLRLLVDTEGPPLSKDSWKEEGLGQFPLAVQKAAGAVVTPAGSGRSGWSVGIERRTEMPGIRVTPRGAGAGPGAGLAVDGTLDVTVSNPRGAPIRSILVVGRVTDGKS